VLERDAAPGIHRIETANVNWYLIEDESGVTVVDAGVPTAWPDFESAMRTIGRPLEDVRALILTHAHFDHIGIAELLRSRLAVDVWVHENDVPLTRHPLQYAHERHPLRYILTQPKALPVIAGFAKARAFFPKPIAHVRRFTDGTLDVPGQPQVVFTPGHTLGHVSFHLPERDALIAGDAVVTFNPYRGEPGPQLVAAAATADMERAMRSLDEVARTGARTVLTGHGPVWTEGAGNIATLARRRGPN
jgi:glyoxylase-like metal-dependent hydrolase (beta-lactamase superfamily II)